MGTVHSAPGWRQRCQVLAQRMGMPQPRGRMAAALISEGLFPGLGVSRGKGEAGPRLSGSQSKYGQALNGSVRCLAVDGVGGCPKILAL